MSDDGVQITELSSVWEDSTENPLALFESTNPDIEAGSYVIKPGERVPEIGWTSHEGDELSVILDGEITLITHENEYTLQSSMLSVIPAGTEHYSINETDTPVRLIYITVGGL